MDWRIVIEFLFENREFCVFMQQILFECLV